MINKSQHLMILALYTLFSVFLGIIFVTLSDSFFVGAGSFFSFFLGFTTYHLFWLGRKVVGRMAGVAKIVSTLDTNKANYEQDIKSVRDIIDNMTDIINTLINNSDSIEENINQQKEKNDMYLSKIHEQMEFMQNSFQTKINDLESQNNRLVSAVDRLGMQPSNNSMSNFPHKSSQSSHNYDSISEFDDSFIQEDFMKLSNNIHVGKISEHKSIYDAQHTPKQNSYSPPKPHHEHSEIDDMLDGLNFSDDFHALKQNSHTDKPSNNGFEFDEDGFLNFDTDDDSFSTLSIPQNIHLNNANSPEKKINTPQLPQEQITEQFDDEFSTIDPHISDSYAHLLQTDHDETFYDTFDDYHTKIIREQINTAPQSHSENPHPQTTHNINDEDEDSFVDITNNINADFTDNLETEDFDTTLTEPQSDNTISQNSASTTHSTKALKPTMPLSTQALPSLAELAPDIQLSKIAKRQKITQTNVPSLDAILNKPLKQKTVPKIPTPSPKENFDDMDYQVPTEPTDTEQNQSFETNREMPNNHNTLVDTIRTAINTNNLTLFTAPVTDYRVREIKFFENYLYLPQGNNTFIPHSEFVTLARKKAMGIDIDRIMITETIRLSKFLKKDVPDVGIFCNISLQSITDAHFEMELYQLLSNKREINNHLIFSFPQEELQALTSIQIEKILHLADMGIRFCVDSIYNILPDLTELARIGIGFIKLRNSDFAKGIYANHQIYKGNQIQEICHQSNILLYVKDVNTHEDLLQAVENQADLLQGDLLGEKERSELLEKHLA